jgi:hypothetical protein
MPQLKNQRVASVSHDLRKLKAKLKYRLYKQKTPAMQGFLKSKFDLSTYNALI